MEFDILNWFFGSGIKIIGIIIVGFLLYLFAERVLKGWIEKIVKEKFKDEKEISLRVKNIYKIFLEIIKVFFVFLLGLLILDQLGVNISPFLVGSGIVGLAISFASQDLAKDFISGFIIIIEDQFHVGDTIKTSELEGKVENLTLRSTLIKDKDGNISYIPNSKIGIVSNLSKKK